MTLAHFAGGFLLTLGASMSFVVGAYDAVNNLPGWALFFGAWGGLFSGFIITVAINLEGTQDTDTLEKETKQE